MVCSVRSERAEQDEQKPAPPCTRRVHRLTPGDHGLPADYRPSNRRTRSHHVVGRTRPRIPPVTYLPYFEDRKRVQIDRERSPREHLVEGRPGEIVPLRVYRASPQYLASYGVLAEAHCRRSDRDCADIDCWRVGNRSLQHFCRLTGTQSPFGVLTWSDNSV